MMRLGSMCSRSDGVRRFQAYELKAQPDPDSAETSASPTSKTNPDAGAGRPIYLIYLIDGNAIRILAIGLIAWVRRGRRASDK